LDSSIPAATARPSWHRTTVQPRSWPIMWRTRWDHCNREWHDMRAPVSVKPASQPASQPQRRSLQGDDSTANGAVRLVGAERTHWWSLTTYLGVVVENLEKQLREIGLQPRRHGERELHHVSRHAPADVEALDRRCGALRRGARLQRRRQRRRRRTPHPHVSHPATQPPSAPPRRGTRGPPSKQSDSARTHARTQAGRHLRAWSP
jgi:hypothetical protein